ncbi:hypothetical protein OCGS_0823 [Oceaniovalibus guishaninsula JLT2003]|uniref:Uncharacterized protein n=1 Tax=Oceaniovalibus guishaninsula JLT2003 TaxID=1231392 RepID=K2HCI6_9RHOB|nr:hypothetical protein [Oceaniovalibus guishaninsula]EKE45128.1 hypothetical protein OCGS_0823 [Oceaniovalibus guishaninsula JLT2003]
MKIQCVASPTVYADAAHRGMSEEDLADLIVRLIWDPSAGRRDGDGFLWLEWRGVRAKYALNETGGDVTILLYRLHPVEAPVADRSRAVAFVKELSVGILRDWIKRKLQQARGE